MGQHVDFHRVPRVALTAALTEAQSRFLVERQAELKPMAGEAVGAFLARWIEAAGWGQDQSDFIGAIEGAERFEGWEADRAISAPGEAWEKGMQMTG
ncbi:MAG: hypothetical protein IPK13_11975 [Deltaproteobacteria bacterium]|nr:hypothetical protein [Deltaproteobacteria bacterium]